MIIKLTTLLKTKFNIKNPHEFIKQLKINGNIGSRSLRKPFEDTPLDRFDIEIIKKYIEYVHLHKHASSNLQYDPIYWMYRCNITFDEAVDKVKTHKKHKSTSKESFIKRHGDILGSEKFEKFQRTSSYSSSDTWFKLKYGEDWEIKRQYDFRRKTKRCVEYWMHRGYSLDDAKNEVKKYQLINSGVNREYYESRGYSNDEIDLIFYDLRKKQRMTNRNSKFLKEKYPNDWEKIYKENADKYRKRMQELGIWIQDDMIDGFIKYRSLVNRYTNENVLLHGDLIENINLRSVKYHLDHKYSIKMGYLNDIDPKIIGSICNLEIIPREINSSKRERCSISKNELLNKYKKLEEKL